MNDENMPGLAVVIPAFKERFFSEALRSLALQTNKNFTLYIGDDCSPQNLRPIAESFSRELSIRYHRFPENIGSKNLVHQWKRCVERIQKEKWIWLFSDDDLASPNIVESFYRDSAIKKSDVFRCNTCVIDQWGKLQNASLSSPDFESSEQMAYNLLHWQRGNSMPDHIFSREIYERSGGFVYTPYAQGADWATSILFSKEKGMHVLQDAMVSWRQSGINVSSIASAKQKEILKGHYCFIEWVLAHFQYLQGGARNGISFEKIRDAALYNLHVVIAKHYKGLLPSQYAEHVAFLRRVFGLSLARSMKELTRLVLKTSPAARKSERAAA